MTEETTKFIARQRIHLPRRRQSQRTGFKPILTAPGREDIVQSVLAELNAREKTVVEMSYGINEDKRSFTGAEIGIRFGIGKDRVRQILAMALRKLNHPKRFSQLKIEPTP